MLAQRWLPPVHRSGLGRLLDWPLRRRVVAVVVIPVLATAVLGGFRVTDLLAGAARAEADAAVSRGQQAAADLAAAVGEEQLATAADAVPGLTPGDSGDTAGTTADLTARRAATDAAAARLAGAMAAVEATVRTPGEEVGARARSLTAALDRLAGIRDDVDTGGRSAVVVVRAVRGMTQVSGTALRLGDALSADLQDVEVQQLARAGQALAAASRQQAVQDALALVTLGRPRDHPAAPAELRSAETARLVAVSHFRDAATQDQQAVLDTVLASDAVVERATALRDVTAATGATPGPVAGPTPVTARDWLRLASASTVDDVRRTLHDTQVARADARRRGQVERAAAEGTATALLLALGLGVTLVAARSILLPLRRLRADAIMIAEERLPAAIARIRDAGPGGSGGSDGSDGGDIRVRPVDVRSSGEIGQVARAFDAVHVEAVRLATEQEQLRRNVNDLFVNLSRRSQALVQRQLALIDRLENDETDPDQLAHLFRLDHLAARMRRNNDNLMVLAGTPTSPGAARAMTVLDVVRAAISETEHYERVTVRGVAPVTVTGDVSHDLVHLLAELLDNATTYSPPDTTVTVDVRTGPTGGARIEVADRGLGIPPGTLAELNARLATAPVADAGVARRMGLYVVAHLAARHGIQVHLTPGAVGQGTTAGVDVPAAVLTEAGDPREAGDPDAAGHRRGDVAVSPAERVRPVPAPVLPGPREVPAAGSPPPAPPTPDLTAAKPTTTGDTNRDTTSDTTGDTTGDEAIDEVGTPIFHELSAWFRVSSPPPAADPAAPAETGAGRSGARPDTPSPRLPAPVVCVRPPPGDPGPDRFAGAADEGWRAVAAVAGARPAVTTAAGLPLRRPMAHRVPGSVPPAPDETTRPGRDAASVRRHLTAYQRGLRDGRRRAGTPPGRTPGGAPHASPAPGPDHGTGHRNENHPHPGEDHHGEDRHGEDLGGEGGGG